MNATEMASRDGPRDRRGFAPEVCGGGPGGPGRTGLGIETQPRRDPARYQWLDEVQRPPSSSAGGGSRSASRC